MYHDRKDAALKLIPYLAKFAGTDAVVLAIPRGGVPIAYYIAKYYKFPVDLLMTKKIGHPDYPEVAIGAVSPEDVITDRELPVTEGYIHRETHILREGLQKRYARFMRGKSPLPLQGKVVIVVDDGIATGSTIKVGIGMVRRKHPSKVIIAAPVGHPESVSDLSHYADECICPYTPTPFLGVGRHYERFPQVSDEEVIFLLNELENNDHEKT